MEKLIHLFLFNCHDINSLLKDVIKLSTFCARLEHQANLFPDRYEPVKNNL